MPSIPGWLRLPATSPSQPLRYTRAYLIYVFLICGVAAVVAALTVPSSSADVAVLLFGSAAAFLMSATSVSLVAGRYTHWSAVGFIHLNQAIVAGAAGALGIAVGSGVGGAVRLRLRDTRVPFNVAIYFLFTFAAGKVFWAVAGSHPSLLQGALAGAAAGMAELLVNVVLLDVAIVLSTPGTDWLALPRSAIGFLPYNLGYGWAAFGGLLLYRQAGVLGVSCLYVPVLLVQLFLISLGRRIVAEERERTEHQRERERLLERFINASQIERQRIARNIHDGVVQDLSMLTAGLRTAADTYAADAEMARTFRRAATSAEESISELRSLMRDIAPQDLAEIGLAAAIEALAEPLREAGTSCSVNIDTEANHGEVIRPAFRISQETLRNVAKHAQARTVTVNGHLRSGCLELVITDDGAGFSPDEVERRHAEGHIGLQLLKDVAADAGGELHIESTPGSGTRVCARLPISV